MTVFEELMNNGNSLPQRTLESAPEANEELLKGAPPGIEKQVNDDDPWGVSERAWKRTSELANKDLFIALDKDRNNELSREEIASGMSRFSGTSSFDLDRRAGLKMLHDSFDQVRGIGRVASFHQAETINKDDLNTFVRIATMRIDADNHRNESKAGESLFRTHSKAILGEHAMPRSEITSHTLRVVGIGLAVNYFIGGWRQALFSAPVYGALAAGTSYATGRFAVSSRMNRLDVALNDWTNKIAKVDNSDFPKVHNIFEAPKLK